MSDDVQTGASAAPTIDAAATSPAPSETSAAPEKPSRFAALMADDAESGEDPAEEASTDGEGTETTEGETPEAEEKPEKAEAKPEEKAPPEDEDVPKDLKQVFKKFPNLRGAYYHQRDVMPLGISVEEAQEYRSEIQSLEDLRYTVGRARQLEAFEGLFTHPDAEAPEKFLDVLRQVDEGSVKRLVHHLATSLKTADPEAYYEIGGEAWDTGLAKLDAFAGDDAFRKDALATVREMIAELTSGEAPQSPPKPKALPSPDAEELARRRSDEATSEKQWWDGLRTQGNQVADREVRALVDEVVKLRDPDGLLATQDVVEKIVNEVHRTVSGSSAVQYGFKQALHDTSIPPDQRMAKIAALIKSRAKNVVDLAYRKQTDGLAERIRKASQLKLGKAAKVVSIREATGGGRPATEPAPAPPRGARMTSRDIFRATMKG